MGVLLKATLRNIFGKPFRSFLVILSIFVCAFVGIFSIDLVQMERTVIENEVKSLSGTADLYTVMRKLDMGRIPEDLPEYEALVINVFTEYLYQEVEGEYQFVNRKNYQISGLDPVKAEKILDLKTTQIGDDEVIITTKLAAGLKAEVGDPLMLYDLAGGKHEFRICDIVPPNDNSFVLSGLGGLVNEEGAKVLACGKPSSVRLMIDVLDDTQIDRAEQMLKDEFGKSLVIRMAMTDEEMAGLEEIAGFLFVLFAITFLLVIFVTFSICERIVGERMSYIGTLRSFGISVGKTALILLGENAMYAILGSAPATLIYAIIRGPVFRAMFEMYYIDATEQPDLPALSIPLIMAVVAVAVLVECLIPLKAVIKAMRISIRDIIFDNRDTEYKYSKVSFGVGVICIVIAVITFLRAEDLYMAAICMISLVSAVGLLYPRILRIVAALLIRIAEKTGSAGLQLAAREAVSKKSTVGSGVLCATSSAMCMVIYLLSVSMTAMFEADTYDCDVIVYGVTKAKDLSFTEYLEDVTDREFIYATEDDSVVIGDDEKTTTSWIYGWPEGGYHFYREITGLPEKVEEGQIYTEQNWAKENGLEIGDRIHFTYNSYGTLPIERDYTLAGFLQASASESIKNNFVVSMKEFQNIYHDDPWLLLIRSDDPKKTAREIERYGATVCSSVETKQEHIEEKKKNNAISKALLYAVIAAAIALSSIGMISNQMIGFEGRKRECAVLLATSMTRKYLARMLFGEMMIASVASVSAGAFVGMVLIRIMKKAFENSEMLALPIEIHYDTVILLWGIMVLIFALTVLLPIRNMRKMKIAEQLKYE